MGKFSKKIAQRRDNQQQQVQSRIKAKYIIIVAAVVAISYVLVIALGR